MTQVDLSRKALAQKRQRPDAAEGQPLDGVRLLRYADLRAAGVPFSRQHIATLEAAGDFPQRLRLSPRVIVWREDAVLMWLASRGRK